MNSPEKGVEMFCFLLFRILDQRRHNTELISVSFRSPDIIK